MENQKVSIENPEQLTVSGAAISAVSIQPTIIEKVHQIKAYGYLHKLEPKPDVTPFELWNIIRWTDIARNTWFGAGEKVCEMLWDNAKELGIEHHFDSQQIDFSVNDG